MSESRSLHGRAFDCDDEPSRRDALGKAMDYRGDVTLELHDGRTIEGFVFACELDGVEPFLEYFPPEEGAPKAVLPCSDVARVVFSGRDTADGQSWEAWVKKWEERKREKERGRSGS